MGFKFWFDILCLLFTTGFGYYGIYLYGKHQTWKTLPNCTHKTQACICNSAGKCTIETDCHHREES